MKHFFLAILLSVSVFLPISAQIANPATGGNAASMKILFFCPKWGQESMPWDAFCQRVKEAGYDGVEAPFPGDAATRQQALDALKKHNLQYVAMVFYNPNPNAHLKDYEQQVRTAAGMKPLFINSHTGKDFTTFEQNKAVIELAAKLAKETGVRVIHETHRGRFTYAANATKTYLDQLPDLRLTLDASHWCAVHESSLDDQPEAMQAAIARTDHIHCRVGHPEGPQVSDPRAPEWKNALEKHMGWWDKIVALHRQKGTTLTITAEFGPPAYLPTLPFTNQPVTNQWDVNVFMMQTLKQRYGK